MTWSSAVAWTGGSASAASMTAVLRPQELGDGRAMLGRREAPRLGELLHRDRLLPRQLCGGAQERHHHAGDVVGERVDELAPRARCVQEAVVVHKLVGQAELDRLGAGEVAPRG